MSGPVGGGGEARMSRAHWWMLAGLTFAWGFNWTAIKVALEDFTPWIFRSLCLSFGALLLFAIARLSRQSLRVPRGMWGRLWLLGFFNVTCWNMLIAYGLMMIPSGRAAILAFTMPVWSVPLSAWMLGEPITRRKLVALALGVAGMLLLLGEEVASLGRAPLGALLALTAALTWAIGTVLQKRLPTGLPTGAFTAWTMLLGGVPVFVGTALFEWGAWRPVGPAALGALAYNVVIAFAFAYWAWFRIAAAVPVAVSSISVLLVPIVGVVCGMLFLGEKPSVAEFLALLLVVAAVLAINLRRGGAPPQPTT
ncbi:MAG: EamA family transporter [Betaproteobacteria bacterium]|nr:EamA family transporter [Betaproteobacteria bacterium]